MMVSNHKHAAWFFRVKITLLICERAGMSPPPPKIGREKDGHGGCRADFIFLTHYPLLDPLLGSCEKVERKKCCESFHMSF